MLWMKDITNSPKKRLDHFADNERFFGTQSFKKLRAIVQELIDHIQEKCEIHDRMRYKINEYELWEVVLWGEVKKELLFIENSLDKESLKADSWEWIRTQESLKPSIDRISNYLFYIKKYIKEQIKIEHEVESLKKEAKKADSHREPFIIPDKIRARLRTKQEVVNHYRRESHMIDKTMEVTDNLR